ncbi:c-type cytochrome [Alysiella filiformis]|uniref:Cytochrome c556 n=1 Tax=Alysiella filiformis DSM 16848 TaxID=1120981 RepID=A0A286E8E0_9NEIS|nr:cytochrome c [Alysiella filiformis]QMT32073.1 cytochrome c [Alysiella filiformis]UBQ57018.1 cytochrome c [Alysiella filiformis DSM 16848]SOD67166.1 Cytochrome c556 [Alysiella filiformis DSM 16848]
MKQSLLIFACASVLLAACGGQESTPAANGSAPAVAGGKGSISEDRSAAFKSFMPTMSKMGKMAKGDEAFSPEAFQAAAEQFSKEARVPFEHFQNDPNGNGDALPNIWANPEAFKAEQDKFLTAVDKLNEVAKTGKLEDIKTAFGNVGASCQSCHDTYRRPK